MKTIGTNITAARKAAQLTQQELADRLGCNQSHVSKLEGGRTEPSVACLLWVARALDVPAASLLDGLH